MIITSDGLSNQVMKVESPSQGNAREPPHRRRSQKERSSETQRKLIDAAIQLVHEFGFRRLTIGDVAHRAGLTSGAIQHHFSSRRALIRGVVHALFPALNIGIDHIAAEGQPVSERMDHLIDGYWRIYSRSEYLVFWELVFGTKDLPEFRDYLRSLQKEITTAGIADFNRLFADCDLPPRQAKKAYVFLTSQLRGLALLSLFEPEKVLDNDLAILKEVACQLLGKRSGGTKAR
jgi:AcrR family transcriptional regulator